MPMDRSRYPPDWPAIARWVKDAAGWHCEECGHPHDPETDYVLTVHHIDGDTTNNTYCNLVALFQRCHLAIHGKKYLIGQWIFPFAQPEWLRRRLAARSCPRLKARRDGHTTSKRR